MKTIFLLLILILPSLLLSQNVSINSTGAAPSACAMLDVSSTTSGFLPPRMTFAQRTAIATPSAGLIVYQTDAGTMGAGFYFYGGSGWNSWSTSAGSWGLSGNAATTPTTNFLGTTDAVNLVVGTANTERFRILSTGEIGINNSALGATNNRLTVNTANVGRAIYAENTFTANSSNVMELQQIVNGRAFYAANTNTTTASVLPVVEAYNNSTNLTSSGESFAFKGTSSGLAGVKGLITGTSAGTGYLYTTSRSGVLGTTTGGGLYNFGVYGYGGASGALRTAGVFGASSNGSNTYAALGYRSSASVDYCIYAFNASFSVTAGAGKMAAGSGISEKNPLTTIGIGVYGGVMGGWIKGLVYGTNFSGEKYGVYVHGNTITNEKFVQLNAIDEGDYRIPSYATQSLTNEITAKGKITMINGQATVKFDDKIVKLCEAGSLIVTATPMGECNGVYIKEVSEKGFSLKELNGGRSNVDISYIISGTIKNATPFTDTDILNKKYEDQMGEVMHNEANETKAGKPIWFDGKDVRYDAIIKSNVDDKSTDQKN